MLIFFVAGLNRPSRLLRPSFVYFFVTSPVRACSDSGGQHDHHHPGACCGGPSGTLSWKGSSVHAVAKIKRTTSPVFWSEMFPHFYQHFCSYWIFSFFFSTLLLLWISNEPTPQPSFFASQWVERHVPLEVTIQRAVAVPVPVAVPVEGAGAAFPRVRLFLYSCQFTKKRHVKHKLSKEFARLVGLGDSNRSYYAIMEPSFGLPLHHSMVRTQIPWPGHCSYNWGRGLIFQTVKNLWGNNRNLLKMIYKELWPCELCLPLPFPKPPQPIPM